MSKIKTIKRRKSWPKWARWYYCDHPAFNPNCYVSQTKPRAFNLGWASVPMMDKVKGPWLNPWTESLRRITD